MENKLIIKKYKNRKLYNTLESSYVNLDDLEFLVRTGVDIKVIDVTTGEDITGITMLQIIATNSKNAFNIDLMVNIIKNKTLQSL